MKKIFKYEAERSKCGKWFVSMPEGSRIIRMSRVDDSQYNGDFVWAIIDTSEACVAQEIDYIPTSEVEEYNIDYPQIRNLKIKEKQKIESVFPPTYACCVDGLPYVFCGEKNQYLDLMSQPIEKTWSLAFYKTGQEIDILTNKLEYIGVCKLNIVQELALYTFLVKVWRFFKNLTKQ